jgi:hypothetical protein
MYVLCVTCWLVSSFIIACFTLVVCAGKQSALAAATEGLEEGAGEGWGADADLVLDEGKFVRVCVCVCCVWCVWCVVCVCVCGVCVVCVYVVCVCVCVVCTCA